MLEQILQKLEKLQALSEVPELFFMLCQEAHQSRRKRLDCWSSSNRSSSEQADFRQAIIDLYGLQEPNNSGLLHSMVTGERLPAQELHAIHIWKSATAGKGQPHPQLTQHGLDEKKYAILRSGAHCVPYLSVSARTVTVSRLERFWSSAARYSQPSQRHVAA